MEESSTVKILFKLLLGIASIIIFIFISFWTLFIYANRLEAFATLDPVDLKKIFLFLGIGVAVILSVILWNFFRKTSTSKLFIYLVFPLILLYLILLLTGIFSDFWAKGFTREKWDKCEYIRTCSIGDLHSKYKIIGMNKEQIFKLLGSNNMFIKKEEGYDVYCYIIGQELTSTYYFKIYMKDNMVKKYDYYNN